jgi:hypothetical protein
MKYLDIIIRTIILIIFLAEIFYIIPKVMIPNIIKEFKKVFVEQSTVNNNSTTKIKSKNIDIRI